MSIFDRLWRRPPRGTLTFLRDGRVLVGFPTGYEPSQVEREQAQVVVRRWLDDPRHDPVPLALPFAVDVVDLREANAIHEQWLRR